MHGFWLRKTHNPCENRLTEILTNGKVHLSAIQDHLFCWECSLFLCGLGERSHEESVRSYTLQTKRLVSTNSKSCILNYMKTMPQRSTDIDILRSVAIVMMVTYHAAYDLHVYRGWGIDVFGMPWTILARTSACIFLVLVGLCFVISWERKPFWRNVVHRTGRILAYACIVSVATYIADPVSYVRFGILHLIGATALLLPLFVKLRAWNCLLGILIIVVSTQLGDLIRGKSVLLLPLGITPPGFVSVDYFPVFPWFGVILVGMALGAVYVRSPERYTVIRASEKTVQQSIILRSVKTISSHSLVIYMLHQPIILAILITMQKILLSM